MSTTIASPLTVEQFSQLDLPPDREWELHSGEVVDMGHPSPRHRRLQRQILHILERLFPDADVLIEYPFSPGNLREVRSADIGVAADRERASETYLERAPDLVVEVLSPLNTVIALKEYRRLCLANGTKVFLTVDPNDRTVDVQLPKEKDSRTFIAGESFAISPFGTAVAIAVDEIFAQM